MKLDPRSADTALSHAPTDDSQPLRIRFRLAAAVAVAIALLLFAVPLPYLVFGPGAAVNLNDVIHATKRYNVRSHRRASTGNG